MRKSVIQIVTIFAVVFVGLIVGIVNGRGWVAIFFFIGLVPLYLAAAGAIIPIFIIRRKQLLGMLSWVVPVLTFLIFALSFLILGDDGDASSNVFMLRKEYATTDSNYHPVVEIGAVVNVVWVTLQLALYITLFVFSIRARSRTNESVA